METPTKQAEDLCNKIYNEIANNLQKDTTAGFFIHCIIYDYLHDINNHKYTNSCYYLQLWDAIDYAPLIIKNMYLLYLADREELEDTELCEINDISADYYYSDEFKPYEPITDDRLKQLSKSECSELQELSKMAQEIRFKSRNELKEKVIKSVDILK